MGEVTVKFTMKDSFHYFRGKIKNEQRKLWVQLANEFFNSGEKRDEELKERNAIMYSNKVVGELVSDLKN